MRSERRTQLYAEEQPEMKDSYGREIDYLRISVTDRCNLRCRYCMPEGIDKLPMPDLLTYEEIEETARAAARLGFRKLKVTGGEPLVRRNVPELIGILKRIPGIREVTVTTNGTLLAEQIGALKAAGLDAVNVSLDTLRPERFREITGTDALASVLEGIQASLDAGIRTKLNAVLQRGVNDDEWEELLLLAKDRALDVRFIEMMPIGAGRQTAGVSNEALIGQIARAYPLIRADEEVHGNGPAVYMHIPGFTGSVGFISAIHGKFCDSCNRLRMTSTGLIKPCLCYRDTVDVRGILRGEGDPAVRAWKLEEALREAVRRKPEAHCFETVSEITEGKRMVQIGG